MQTLRALRRLLLAVACDPVRALCALALSPVRVGRYLPGALLIAVLATPVFCAAGMGLVHALGLSPHHPAYALLVFAPMVGSLLVIWRMLTRPLLLHFGDRQADNTHGPARFATAHEPRALKNADGTASTASLLIGRDADTGHLLRYDGPAHLLTLAPTRSGKGVSAVIPNLLVANRSIVCVDPKGENARLTCHARERFGPVHVLDPFGVTAEHCAAFNPLAELSAASADITDQAAAIADALVYDAPGETGEAHWNDEAKALIAGLVLYLVTEAPAAQRTLTTLREYLSAAPGPFEALLLRMQHSTAADGHIARVANRFLGKPAREAGDVRSTAQRHTHFLDSPRMERVLGRSDFAFADLKLGTTTVFLVLPPERMGAYARWLRLMLTCALADMAATPVRPAAPVLFLLDEFAALGHLAPVEQAMGLMAGDGVQLWPLVQDIHQLRAIYGTRAGTFLANADVLQVFGVNDHDSAKLVPDPPGQETVEFETASRAPDVQSNGLSYAEQHTDRPRLMPDEVRYLPMHIQLLFVSGRRPVTARKLSYHMDREFADLWRAPVTPRDDVRVPA